MKPQWDCYAVAYHQMSLGNFVFAPGRGICSLQSKSSLSCDALIIIFTIDADTQWTVIMKVFFSTEDVHLQSLFELGHDMHFSFFSNICKLSHAYRRARHVSWPGGKM